MAQLPIVHLVPVGAATCSEGFVYFFLKVPQAVGLYCSCHAAQASKGNFKKKILQNLRNKWPPHPVEDCRLHLFQKSDSLEIGCRSPSTLRFTPGERRGGIMPLCITTSARWPSPARNWTGRWCCSRRRSTPPPGFPCGTRR